VEHLSRSNRYSMPTGPRPATCDGCETPIEGAVYRFWCSTSAASIAEDCRMDQDGGWYRPVGTSVLCEACHSSVAPWRRSTAEPQTCVACSRPVVDARDREKPATLRSRARWEDAPPSCSPACDHIVYQRRYREQRSRPNRVRCNRCQEMFLASRSTAKYCSTRCRVRAHRAKPAASGSAGIPQ
jgi:hypothetical protein